MRTMRVVTVICWGVVAAVLLGLAVWFLTGTVFGIGGGLNRGLNIRPGFNIGGFESLSGPFQPVGTQNAPAAGLNSISIDWVSGEVTVAPHDGAEIVVTELAQRELRDNERFHITNSGGTLSIRFREQGVTVGNMPQKRLEVLVPTELSGNMNTLSVSSVSGAVSISGFDATVMRVGTTSGSIRVSDAVARALQAKSTSGSVSVVSVSSDDIKAGSTSGSVTLTSVQAAGIDIDSISGSIRVSDSSARLIDGSSTSGSIDVSGAFDRADLGSLSGRVSLENAALGAIVKASSTSGSVTLTGAFESVEADSLSGSISIRSSMVPSSLKSDTTSGSTTITVPDEGAVTVFHSSTSGRFSSDIPVIMQGRGAQFELKSLSGSIRIHAMG
jgi:DUF4097 and DUF4098 domain-containing protein YvlB